MSKEDAEQLLWLDEDEDNQQGEVPGEAESLADGKSSLAETLPAAESLAVTALEDELARTKRELQDVRKELAAKVRGLQTGLHMLGVPARRRQAGPHDCRRASLCAQQRRGGKTNIARRDAQNQVPSAPSYCATPLTWPCPAHPPLDCLPHAR